MEMQYADYTEFVSTSHDFLEDVMNVLDTEQPQYHLVCNSDKIQRVHVHEKDRIGRRVILLMHSWGRARCILQGATSQFSISVNVWSVYRSQCITRAEDQVEECLGQTGTTLQQKADHQSVC